MNLKFEDLPEAIGELIEQNRQILKLVLEKQTGKSAEEEVMTLSDVCEFLELKKQTIYTYASKRQIPFHKKAGKLYFFKEEIMNWIKTGKQERLVTGVKFNSKRKNAG